MALVKCSECTKEVSDTATLCPHCGKRLKKKKSSIFLIGKIVLIIGVLCLIFATAEYITGVVPVRENEEEHCSGGGIDCSIEMYEQEFYMVRNIGIVVSLVGVGCIAIGKNNEKNMN